MVAGVAGTVTSWLLHGMNYFIASISELPFAVYSGIQNSLAETLLLYVVITCLAYWLVFTYKPAFFAGIIALLLFVVADGVENYHLLRQRKIIVYNIPQHTAVDFLQGRQYAFWGDSALQEVGYLHNFHLKPSRTANRISETNYLQDLYVGYPFVQFCAKRMLVVDKPFVMLSPKKIPLDLIVVSHNPRVKIADLCNAFSCGQFVFDGSNSAWKIRQWEKDCDSLHLRHYSTPDNGAFVWELDR